MSDSYFEPPAANELEVSLFGPGYGEAIALHIGEGKWVLVDSCVEPYSKLPASLKYLYDLTIDVEDAVKFIVATHWHDDHVRGIGTILSECKSANIAISNSLRLDEFLNLAALYRGRPMSITSGIDEFVQIFQHLETRKQHGARFNPPKLASADKLLYSEEIHLNSGTIEAKLFALSPSDASVLQSQLAFAQLLPEGGLKKRVVSPAPNHASVVLWVEVGSHKILLGADLERSCDPNTGWSVILGDSTVVSGKAGAFKIPHHGSENAHHNGVWSELLSEEPFAILSPFRKGSNALPSPQDIKRIALLTSYAYATAPARRRSQQWRNKVVRDLVGQATRNIQDIHYGYGHIRLRCGVNQTYDSWRVELFGDAYALEAQ